MELSEIVQEQETRDRMIADCVQLIDEQVSEKGGVSGLALKAAYKVIKGIGPTYIPSVLNWLLPEALKALTPLWNEGLQSGDPVAHLKQNQSRAADVVLGVTDAKIEKAKNTIVRGTYQKLRKSVKGDVESAVPGLADIIGRYAVA